MTGSTGQLGTALRRSLTRVGEVLSLDRGGLDLAQVDAIAPVTRRYAADVIVNAAAYTAVERAEREPELAHRINALAPGVLADEARRSGALFVHFSTDYVFDGAKRSPYHEEDQPAPLNAYGRTKLAGEEAVRQAGGRWIVLRTSWVYSNQGRNFLLAILEKGRRERSISVVADQTGAPTWARTLADATAHIVSVAHAGKKPTGLFHLTASGSTTWLKFAEEILRTAGLSTKVLPTTSDQYPGVRRPQYSVLSNEKIAKVYGLRLADWRTDMEACLQTIFQP